MPKGFFTQCACILLEQEVSLAEIEPLLASFHIVNRIPNPDSPWMFAGPSLVIEFAPEVNGCMSVDIVNQKWPDHMGDAQEEHFLFGAWATGQFGPCVYPGGLDRATQQSWTWDAAAATVARHNAFIRLRMSYVFGAEEDAPTIPANYDAIAELDLMMDAVARLLELPEALCYFNPSGEVLRPYADFLETLQECRSAEQPALALISNIRLYGIDDEWSVMDTVGLQQLDLDDNETCFLRDRYKPEDIDFFLRDLTLYLLQSRAIINDGNTTNGPHDILMRARTVDTALVDPPRQVLRWLPEDGSNPPASVI